MDLGWPLTPGITHDSPGNRQYVGPLLLARHDVPVPVWRTPNGHPRRPQSVPRPRAPRSTPRCPSQTFPEFLRPYLRPWGCSVRGRSSGFRYALDPSFWKVFTLERLPALGNGRFGPQRRSTTKESVYERSRPPSDRHPSPILPAGTGRFRRPRRAGPGSRPGHPAPPPCVGS